MEEDLLFPGDPADLFDRLESSDLIIAVHNGNQNGFFGDRFGNILGIDPPFSSTGI